MISAMVSQRIPKKRRIIPPDARMAGLFLWFASCRIEQGRRKW
jgi:hypothetical protein